MVALRCFRCFEILRFVVSCFCSSMSAFANLLRSVIFSSLGKPLATPPMGPMCSSAVLRFYAK